VVITVTTKKGGRHTERYSNSIVEKKNLGAGASETEIRKDQEGFPTIFLLDGGAQNGGNKLFTY